MNQPLQHKGTNAELGRVLPNLEFDPGCLAQDLPLLPGGSGATESCGMGSNCEALMPRAVIVWGEMTLAKVFPLSTKALTASFASCTGTYAL